MTNRRARNNRPRIGDGAFQDDHAVLAQVVTALENHLSQFSEFKDAIFERMDRMDENQSQLNLRERERNGNIEKIIDRMDMHDLHHGEGDIHIGERFEIMGNRLVPLESDLAGRSKEDIRSSAKKEVLIAEWKLVVGTISSIGIGAIIGAIGSLLGVWGF